MVCLHVRGDSPRALARGLSPVQVDNHRIYISYHLHQCIRGKYEIPRANVVSKGWTNDFETALKAKIRKIAC